jgi:hypothetical protein
MKEIEGDLFEQEADAVCLTTNGSVKKDSRAVMGRGVALKATQIWLGIELQLGNHLKVFGNTVAPLRYDKERKIAVVSFPVKDQWFEVARLDLIDQSCKALLELTNVQGWSKVILPRPGCGNGGLSWETVKPIVEQLDDRFIVVYKPGSEYEDLQRYSSGK